MVKWITRDVVRVPPLSHKVLVDVLPDQHHARDHSARHGSGQPDAVSLDAGQIVSGRFGMARMPDGTDGYVLTAKGIGVDPAYTLMPAATGNGILEKLQKHLGLWWFNKNWLPSGMVSYGSSGSGYLTWDDENIGLLTGTTSSSYAYAYKDLYGINYGHTWDKKRHLSTLVTLSTYSYQYAHLVTGMAPVNAAANTAAHIGFKLIDANLYGTVGNGTAESTLLLETIAAAVRRRLECVLDPAIPECRFYLDGVDKGAITTNLPSGTTYADRVLRASIYNTEAADKRFFIYEWRVFQEE